MARKRRSNDIDHQYGSQGITQRPKKPRRAPPEPGPLPEYTLMYIQPISNWHKTSKLPKHVNPANAYEIFSLFFSEEVLETIAKHTNEYAAYHRQVDEYTRPRPWKDTTPKELMAYITTYIWMGLHPKHDVAEYWNTDADEGPIHKPVRKHIRLVRWQQLDRFLHISKPKQGNTRKESPFDKLEPLNEILRIAVKKYWNPTTDITVDEAIQRFIGRAKETVNIPSKPTPEGFKIWVLANARYILDWLFHARGLGPVDLDEYWIKYRGFPATQAVVLDLLLQEGIHNDSRHIVWLDNLFTSVRLLATLHEEGFGAAGTVRTTQSKAEWLTDTAADTAPATQQSQQQTQQTQQTQRSQSSSSISKRSKKAAKRAQNGF